MQRNIMAGIAILWLVSGPARVFGEEPPVTAIGDRLELMLDNALIDSMSGDARLMLHHPVPREIVFRTDAPWEGNASSYQSVFRDGDICRMYYRGGHYKDGGKPAEVREPHPWVLCYAESKDGLTWHRPKLGIREWEGSTANNIVLDTAMMAAFQGCPAHTSVFVDKNPDCPADQRIKIIAFGAKPRGLYVLGSPDGLHFRVLSDQPIQTIGAFDSQNLVFWDSVRGEYRMYHRGFRGSVRDVYTATSKDILHFPEPQWLDYPDSPTMALYTNQIQPYFRAPHIFVGFPKRYCDRGWSGPMLDLPGREVRLVRAKHSRRYGTTITDAVFMSSRDGRHFKRWAEAFLRPGPKRSGSWVYGDNFIFWGMLQTRSIYGDAPDDLSFYVVEGYWEGAFTSFRRYTLRTDGFVSAHAPYAGGDVVTKPLAFTGGNLSLNLSTSAFGSLQVEIQDLNGVPIDGYTLEECPPIFCDRLDYTVRWRYAGGDVRPLAGKPVRLRFHLRDADLYAFRFAPYKPDPPPPDQSGIGLLPPKNRQRSPFTVVDDDFSAYPAGISPTTEDLDPAEGDDDHSGWRVLEGSPDRVQILKDDPVGSGKPGTGAYLKAIRLAESAGKGGQAWVVLSPHDAADTTDGIVTLEARIMVPATISYCADIDAYDDPPGEYAHRAFNVRFFPDGAVKIWCGTHIPVEEMSFTPGEWTEVSIHADLKTSTFDLTVNGRTASGLPFGVPGIHRIRSIEFGPNTHDCVLYVDRVRVKVEP